VAVGLGAAVAVGLGAAGLVGGATGDPEPQAEVAPVAEVARRVVAGRSRVVAG